MLITGTSSGRDPRKVGSPGEGSTRTWRERVFARSSGRRGRSQKTSRETEPGSSGKGKNTLYGQNCVVWLKHLNLKSYLVKSWSNGRKPSHRFGYHYIGNETWVAEVAPQGLTVCSWKALCLTVWAPEIGKSKNVERIVHNISRCNRRLCLMAWYLRHL